MPVVECAYIYTWIFHFRKKLLGYTFKQIFLKYTSPTKIKKILENHISNRQ